MKKLIAGLTIGMLIGSATLASAATAPSIKATLTKYNIVLGGQVQQLSANQIIYKGNTYIQLREAGSLFGYNASFKNKTITFTTKDGNLNNWISLADFSSKTGYEVEPQEENENIYDVINNKTKLFSVNATGLKEHEHKSVATSKGKTVTFTKYKGSILLDRAELIAAGLIK
ncbi:hypothetical protein [Paenibacillus sp. FSL K6-1318]|uniref:hypothetical protein n=1 Tax=Paenibacillus sp. FSL K6-1318 TaxID=2975291 RepID=UPI0030EC751D